MGKITINLECNSIEEAKALLDFLSGYRKAQKKEEIDTAMTALKEVSANPVEVGERKITAEDVNRCTKDVLKSVSKPVEIRDSNTDKIVRDGVPDEVKDRLTAEVISRFAVSLLRQGKGGEIKRLLGEYGAKAFTDLPKDKMDEFFQALRKI